MKKKRNLIGVCLVAVLMLALTVIGYAAGDGEAAPEYGAWCLVPPLVTIVLAFVTKQTIISMFIGIWVGATIIHHFNPIDGLIGSFTGYLVPSIADSWNAGMLIIMALIGGFMYMLSACGGAEAFGRWAEKVANNRKKSQLLAWIAPFVFIFNQGCLLVGVIMRPVTDKTHISRVKLAYITDAMGAPLVSMSPISDNGVYLVGLLAAEIAALNLTGVGAYDLYFGMFQFNLYGVFSVITVLLVILFGLDVGPMYKAEKLAIETGKTYSESDVLVLKQSASGKVKSPTPLHQYVADIYGNINSIGANAISLQDTIVRSRTRPTAYVVPADVEWINKLLYTLDRHGEDLPA